jgi:hypothetical protein
MDIQEALLALYAQKKRLENAIAELEELAGEHSKRRGRKSMAETERQQVSERMKRYWAARREERLARTDSTRR